MSSFDAEALERAAKAARELEGSRHVKQAVEMSKREQNVKAKEHDARRAEALAESERAKAAQIQMAGEERRKTIAFERKAKEELMGRQQQMERQKLQEADQLARQREADMLEAKKRADAERDARRLQTERQIQEERLEFARRQAQMDRENIHARAEAEAKGRILEQRTNEDILARNIKRRGEARAEELRAAIQETFTQLSSTLGGYIKDTTSLRNTVAVATALALGVYGVREGSRVAARVLEKRLLTPSLVRETSRTTGAFGLRRRVQKTLGLLPAEETGLSGIVLPGQLQSRVEETAVATANTRRNGAAFRHMLFYGPPGTGKTMVAKRLARTSGLDYAVMSGGDIGPLGKEGVTELHKLLDWGETSGRGLLLFIDEADAFLASRARSSMSENHRNALNALLYRTGEASRSLMLVLATNRPGDLDAAVTDRVDDAVMFGLPDEPARRRLMEVYFEKYVVRAGEDAPRRAFGLLAGAKGAKIEVGEGFTEGYFDELAARTAGFSGRAISKLMLGVQGAVYGRGKPVLSLELMEEVVQRKLDEFEERRRLAGADYTDTASEAVTGTKADAAARAGPRVA